MNFADVTCPIEPRDCHFVQEEGSDFAPIQMSQELKRLRLENQELRTRLRALEMRTSDDTEGTTSAPSPTIASDKRSSRQKRFRPVEQAESIYFGSPALASVISDV